MWFVDVMAKGGIVMWFLLLSSVFALAVIIDRAWFFARVIDVKAAPLFSKISLLVKQDKIKDAIDLCDERKTPMTLALRAALEHSSESRETIKEAVNDVVLREIPYLEKKLPYLATIAHVAPLLGLLGTVTGIIKCFSVIQIKAAENGSINPSDLAGGIMEALHTTAFGLVVAIPSLIAYNFFVSRVNHKVMEMERLAVETIALLSD